MEYDRTEIFMKKRLIALLLIFVIAFSCLVIPASADVSNNEELAYNILHAAIKSQMTKNDSFGNCYVYPFGTTFGTSVTKGDTAMLQFQRNKATPSSSDVFAVIIFKGSISDIIYGDTEPVIVETREYKMSQFSKPSYALAMSWKADSRYSTGDYTLIYAVTDSQYREYEQTYYYVELHVNSKNVPMNGIELWNNNNGDFEETLGDSVYVNVDASTMILLEKLPYNTTSKDSFAFSIDKPQIVSASMKSGYLNIKGLCGGKAVVTVRCGSVKKNVYVTAGKLKSLSISAGKSTLCVGMTDTIRIDADSAGKPVYYEWSTSDPKVATVKNGVVTAVSPGTAEISVRAYNDMVRTLKYTVQYHQLPENTPVTTRTATQPKQAVGHCSVCGKDNAVNVYEPAIFTDTKASAWYAEHVDKVYDLGLMNGTGEHTFAPNANVNRAMAATVLYRIAGEPEIEGESPFNDVPAGKYFTNAVIWAEQNGIVNGYPDGTFRPDVSITREQLAAILYRYAGAEGKATAEAAELGGFPDASKVHSYAQEAMAWSVGAGLINGVGSDGKSYLQPASNASRAQFATIISRYMTTVDTLTPEVPETQNDPAED